MLPQVSVDRVADLAWAAGIIDGEGCIRIQRRRKGPGFDYRLDVGVEMCHIGTIDRLFQIFVRGSTRMGTTKSPLTNHHQLYCWKVVGHDAANVLRCVLPYLLTKRERAELALEFMDRFSPQPGGKRTPEPVVRLRESFYQRMTELIHGTTTTERPVL